MDDIDESGQCGVYSCVCRDSVQQKQTSWSQNSQNDGQMDLFSGWISTLSLHIHPQAQLCTDPQDNRGASSLFTTKKPWRSDFPKSWLKRSQKRRLTKAEELRVVGWGRGGPRALVTALSLEPEKFWTVFLDGKRDQGKPLL